LQEKVFLAGFVTEEFHAETPVIDSRLERTGVGDGAAKIQIDFGITDAQTDLGDLADQFPSIHRHQRRRCAMSEIDEESAGRNMIHVVLQEVILLGKVRQQVYGWMCGQENSFPFTKKMAFSKLTFFAVCRQQGISWL